MSYHSFLIPSEWYILQIYYNIHIENAQMLRKLFYKKYIYIVIIAIKN